jgi:hypothetical protein
MTSTVAPRLPSPPDGSVELATLLSTAVRIEPQLIRLARLTLLPHLDVGAEADLWFSSWVAFHETDAIMLRADVINDLRLRLTERLAGDPTGTDPAHRAGRIVARMHAGSPAAVRLEEDLAWLSVQPGGVDLEGPLLPVLRAAVGEIADVNVMHWFVRAWPRLPEAARETVTAWKIAQVARARVPGAPPMAQDGVSGIVLADVADIAGKVADIALPVRRLRDELVLGVAATGTDTVIVPDTDPRIVDVTWMTGSETENRTVYVPAGGSVTLPVGAAELWLRTARGVLYAMGSPAAAAGPRVYLPYGFDTADHHRSVFECWRLLRGAGVDVTIGAPQAGGSWVEEQLAGAAHIVVVGRHGVARTMDDPVAGLLRDDPARQHQVVAVLLPGDTPAQLPEYARGLRTVAVPELTESGVLPLVELLRGDRSQPAAARSQSTVALRYAPEDQVWAEWVTALLEAAGVTVNSVAAGWAGRVRMPEGRSMILVSAANSDEQIPAAVAGGDDPRTPLVVYVDDARPLRGQADSASLAGQTEETAAARVLALVGSEDENVDLSRIGVRFPGKPTRPFNAPIRNARFTGREDDLLALRQYLQGAGQTVVLAGATAVTLQGMGGIGKTQVALEYAHRFRGAYDAVWWINADPVQFIDTQLADLGRQLDLPGRGGVAEQVEAVLAALRRGETAMRWLVVFDNAEDIERVSSFLPSGPGVHVVITSRNPQWSDRAQAMQVDVFQRPESVEHLRRRVPSIRTDEADRVADLLGDLPIAIAAAGAWLRDTGTPIAEYLRQIEQYGPDTGSGRSSVEATWDLSLQRLQERSAAAYRLLQLCSVLAPEIALDLVYSDEMADQLAPLDLAVSERFYRGALVQQINRLALLKLDVGGGQIQLHRLLQHVVRQRMSPAELDEARHQAQLVLAASRPPAEVDDPVSWPRFHMLWPHLEVVRAYDSREEPVRRLAIDRVRYLWLTGGYAEARRVAELVLRQWDELQRTLTDEAERLAVERQSLHLRFNLGNVLREQSSSVESRTLNEQVLARQRELLGDNHPHTLMTASSLAADLRALGLYADALSRDKRTYAAWSENFGDDHPRTLSTQNNLAVSYRLTGDFRSARERDSVVYERFRVVLGDMHPNTLSAGGNLGRDLREAGDYDGSISLLRDVAGRLATALGADSPRTHNALTNLAVSLRCAGRAQESAPLLEAAYENLTETFGPASPDTLACRLSRALNVLALGQPDIAREELAAVERSYRASYGESHPHTVACLSNLAVATRASGEPAIALSLARQSADAFDQALGSDHPYTLGATMNAAVMTAEHGDIAVALDVLVPVADRIDRLLGPGHPDTASCLANLALIRASTEPRFPEEAQDAVRRLTEAFGRTHPAVAAFVEHRFLYRVIDPHPY